MEKLINLTLALSLIFSSVAQAAPQPLNSDSTPEQTEKYLGTTQRILSRSAFLNTMFFKNGWEKKVESGVKTALAKPAGSIMHSSQTILMIWILTCIEAIRQKHEMNNYQNKSMTARESFALSVQAMDHLLNSFDLFTSIAGGSIVGTLFSKPLNALGRMIHARTSREILAKLLHSGAVSFITFIGWEAGGQLWREASQNLDTEPDILAARDLKLMDILSGNANEEQKRVFGKIIDNMFKILTFGDPDLGRSWIYNTWRMRIATGDFVVLVTSMVTFGVLAGSIVPGAGNLVGFCFGLIGGVVGGVVAIAIPQSVKDPITYGIQSSRISTNRMRLYTNKQDLRRISWAFGQQYMLASQEYQEKEFMRYLLNRSGLRNNILTVHFERYYKYQLQRQETEQIISLIRQSYKLNQTAKQQLTPEINASLELIEVELPRTVREANRMIADLQEKLVSINQTIAETEKDLLEFYFPESDTLMKLYYNQKFKLPEKIKRALEMEVSRIEVLNQYVKHIVVGLRSQKTNSLGIDINSDEDLSILQMAAQINLNSLYMNAFREGKIY